MKTGEFLDQMLVQGAGINNLGRWINQFRSNLPENEELESHHINRIGELLLRIVAEETRRLKGEAREEVFHHGLNGIQLLVQLAQDQRIPFTMKDLLVMIRIAHPPSDVEVQVLRYVEPKWKPRRDD